MTQAASVRSVDRALRILGAFEADRREVGVAELAGLLGVHASTASRLAATLAAHGFLERDGRRDAFRLGPQMIRLGLLAAGGESLVAAARPVMEKLAAETGETVVLSVPSDHRAVDVAQVDSRYLVGGQSWVGRSLPLHATSDGKVLLAWEAATLPPGALERVTPSTITSRRQLERELAGARAMGFAQAVGECEPRLNGVAAPIFAADGRCIAALSVSGPDYRLPATRIAEAGARCRAAADEVSRRRGFGPNGDRP